MNQNRTSADTLILVIAIVISLIAIGFSVSSPGYVMDNNVVYQGF